jgi:hypothetical protein
VKILIKTESGQIEMARRQLGLSQRHRTMLILVDGKRTRSQVLELAAQVGISKAYLDEISDLGLVTDAVAHGRRAHELQMGYRAEGRVLARTAPVPDASDSTVSDWGQLDDSVGFGMAMTNSELAALDVSDTLVSEARKFMVQALRLEAPLSGAITMLKVRRARTRNELAGLLHEVRGKIAGAHERSEAALLFRRALTLLA